VCQLDSFDYGAISGGKRRISKFLKCRLLATTYYDIRKLKIHGAFESGYNILGNFSLFYTVSPKIQLARRIYNRCTQAIRFGTESVSPSSQEKNTTRVDAPYNDVIFNVGKILANAQQN